MPSTGRPVTRAMARARAKESLAIKREVWKQEQRTDEHAPDNAHDVELNAQLAYRLARSTSWVLASETGARLSDTPFQRQPALDRLQTVATWEGVVQRWVYGGRMTGATPRRDRIRALTAAATAERERQLRGDWLPDRELALFSPSANVPIAAVGEVRGRLPRRGADV